LAQFFLPSDPGSDPGVFFGQEDSDIDPPNDEGISTFFFPSAGLSCFLRKLMCTPGGRNFSLNENLLRPLSSPPCVHLLVSRIALGRQAVGWIPPPNRHSPPSAVKMRQTPCCIKSPDPRQNGKNQIFCPLTSRPKSSKGARTRLPAKTLHPERPIRYFSRDETENFF